MDCPRCGEPCTRKHCTGPACPWWRCTTCNIEIDAAGRTIPQHV
ncbi:hypothetical protein Xcel_0543 [Xylanimonas cellulosilytica DSM 15894]|uniref:Uncharacterized protein n=1 Tax=Xylanimonas cellulosilytica (strain DSM 15894 / JCM 12276 / CECT 5975 / KCTC 9989 / LMG 20990 / NBRC 107835 / XIL07) TaxID=446471 RepID=D1BW79_XYLCX|nr:hypothetical protein Xcel_0543 [Xylanimonas cellulosilytica DSM 15894]